MLKVKQPKKVQEKEKLLLRERAINLHRRGLLSIEDLDLARFMPFMFLRKRGMRRLVAGKVKLEARA